MGKIAAPEFLKNPESHLSHRLFVLAGEEYFFLSTARRVVLEAIRRREPEAAYERLDRSQVSGFAELCVRARSISMWASRQVLCLSLDKKMMQNELEALDEYLQLADAPGVLLLEWSAPDERLKFSQMAQKRGCWISCQPLPDRALVAWIKETAREKGLSVSPAVADLMVDIIGNNPSLLHQEIEKASLYDPQAKSLSEDVLRKIASPFRSFAWFDLTDAIGARRTGEALRIVQSLMQAGENAVGILAGAASHLRKLFQVRVMLDMRAPKGQIIKDLRLHPYYGEKLIGQAQAFTARALEDAMEGCYRCDLALKSGASSSDRIVMERLVVAMTKGLGSRYAA
jgi:DNA polymerase-3 subunit delta